MFEIIRLSRHVVALVARQRAARASPREVHRVSADAQHARRRTAEGVEGWRRLVASSVTLGTGVRAQLHLAVDVQLGPNEALALVDHVAMAREAAIRLRMRRGRREPVTRAAGARGAPRLRPNCLRGAVTVAVLAGARDRIVARLVLRGAGQGSEVELGRGRVVGVAWAIDALWDDVALLARDGAVGCARLEVPQMGPHAGIARFAGTQQISRRRRLQ